MHICTYVCICLCLYMYTYVCIARWHGGGKPAAVVMEFTGDRGSSSGHDSHDSHNEQVCSLCKNPWSHRAKIFTRKYTCIYILINIYVFTHMHTDIPELQT